MKAYSITGVIFSLLFLLLSFWLLDLYQGTGNPLGVIIFLLSSFFLTISIISLVKSINSSKK